MHESAKKFGVEARYTDANHYYRFYYDNNRWRIYKKNGSSAGVLASSATESIAVGDEFNLTFELDGSTLKGYVDGVLKE